MTDTVVFTYMRCNPPTAGHGLVIKKLIAEAKKHKADHVVFLSQSVKPETDPLPWEYKKRIAESFFPGVIISSDKSAKTPFVALESLGKTYNKVVMVVGEDRVDTFESQMRNYLDEFGISDFSVVCAGQRLNEGVTASNVSGVSASNARKAVLNNDYSAFKSNMPTTASKYAISNLFGKLRELASD